MRSDADIEDAIDLYGDMVLRACSAYLPSRHDAEDAFQDTFVRYATADVAFNDGEHRKAWLIRVAINICKDRLRSAESKAVSIEGTETDVAEPASENDRTDEKERMRTALRKLPEDNRVALILSVVEGYTAPQIAEIMGKPLNTVYSLITRGKEKLRKVLEDDRG